MKRVLISRLETEKLASQELSDVDTEVRKRVEGHLPIHTPNSGIQYIRQKLQPYVSIVDLTLGEQEALRVKYHTQ